MEPCGSGSDTVLERGLAISNSCQLESLVTGFEIRVTLLERRHMESSKVPDLSVKRAP